MSQPYAPEPSAPDASATGEADGSAAAKADGSAARAAALHSFRQRFGHLPRQRRTRVLALGAAVVVLGGLAGTAAIAAHHFEHGGGERGGYWAADGRGERGGFDGRGGAMSQDGEGNVIGQDGQGNLIGPDGTPIDGMSNGGKIAGKVLPFPGGKFPGGPFKGGQAIPPGANLAPAPIPAITAGAAVEKAAGAVQGGKVDSLRVVGQQGGGSAWELDVLGPDGVRHLVTVDGTNGTVTSNTVAPGGTTAGR